MSTVFWKVSVVAAILAMITVNALANVLPINGVTTGAVSDGYATFFVPAGYVFSIWGLIYLALLGLAATQLFSPDAQAVMARVRPLLVLSCAANAAWILCWHHYQLALSVAVMLTLLVTLTVMHRRVQAAAGPRPSWLVRWTVAAPISLYLAWICVATIANVSALLAAHGWDGAPLAGPTWAAIMMAVAGGLIGALAVRYRDGIPPLVLAWALVGIVVKFPDHALMRIVGISATGAMLALAVSVAIRPRRVLATP